MHSGIQGGKAVKDSSIFQSVITKKPAKESYIFWSNVLFWWMLTWNVSVHVCHPLKVLLPSFIFSR